MNNRSKLIIKRVKYTGLTLAAWLLATVVPYMMFRPESSAVVTAIVSGVILIPLYSLALGYLEIKYDLETAEDKADDLPSDMQEIERKFVMRDFPEESDNLQIIKHGIVTQTYLSVNPEVRIRKSVYDGGRVKAALAVKSAGTLTRNEVEIEIGPEEFEVMLPMAEGKPLTKDYYNIKMSDGRVLQISRVNDKMVYAEVEFDSEEEALSWQPIPEVQELIIKEVTDDPSYKMKNFWVKENSID